MGATKDEVLANDDSSSDNCQQDEPVEPQENVDPANNSADASPSSSPPFPPTPPPNIPDIQPEELKPQQLKFSGSFSGSRSRNLDSNTPRSPPLTNSGRGPRRGTPIADVEQFRQLKETYYLNVMVVGESGLGKTTFINTFFRDFGALEPLPPGISTQISEHNIEARLTQGSILKLNLIDTPGYGNKNNPDEEWVDILGYINEKLTIHLREESRVPRPPLMARSDGRVHLVFYFIAPHRLKQLDINALKNLHGQVNIVPLIGKADTMSTEELSSFREEILEKLAANGIIPYRFLNEEKQVFAVIGGKVLSNGRVMGRQYPWGTADCHDESHSDLPLLERILLRDGMPALYDSTDTIFENYRMRSLTPPTARQKCKRFFVVYRTLFLIVIACLVAFALVHFGVPAIKELMKTYPDHEAAHNHSQQVINELKRKIQSLQEALATQCVEKHAAAKARPCAPDADDGYVEFFRKFAYRPW